MSNGLLRNAIGNTLIGVVGFFIILASLFHYGGVWYSLYLPMSDSSTYDNTGAIYDVSRVLSADFTLDEEAYKAYSPLFIRSDYSHASFTPCPFLLLWNVT